MLGLGRSLAAASLRASLSRAGIVTRGLATTSALNKDVKRLAVFGAGSMGSGIAQTAAQGGVKVTIIDTNDKALARGLDIINKSLPRVAKKQSPDDIDGFVKRALANIETTTDVDAGVRDVDVIVEAIVENLQVKQDLFSRLDKIASPDTVFASNTSSLLITDIASTCSDARKKNFGGMHFFNPVPVMKLVEVIRTKETSDAAFDTLLDLAKKTGRVAVKAKDVPGFIVNRLLVPYKLEAVRMVERGDATPEDVDTAMRYGAGYPMGPFELSDYTGIDITQAVAEAWVEYANRGMIPMELIKPVPLMGQMVKEGRLGRKTGKGFFDYSKDQNKKG